MPYQLEGEDKPRPAVAAAPAKVCTLSFVESTVYTYVLPFRIVDYSLKKEKVGHCKACGTMHVAPC